MTVGELLTQIAQLHSIHRDDKDGGAALASALASLLRRLPADELEKAYQVLLTIVGIVLLELDINQLWGVTLEALSRNAAQETVRELYDIGEKTSNQVYHRILLNAILRVDLIPEDIRDHIRQTLLEHPVSPALIQWCALYCLHDCPRDILERLAKSVIALYTPSDLERQALWLVQMLISIFGRKKPLVLQQIVEVVRSQDPEYAARLASLLIEQKSLGIYQIEDQNVIDFLELVSRRD